MARASPTPPPAAASADAAPAAAAAKTKLMGSALKGAAHAVRVGVAAQRVQFGACASAAAGEADDRWRMTEKDRTKYGKVFKTNLKADVTVPKDKAVSFLARSKLPKDTLERIFTMVDIGGEGEIDEEEWCARCTW